MQWPVAWQVSAQVAWVRDGDGSKEGMRNPCLQLCRKHAALRAEKGDACLAWLVPFRIAKGANLLAMVICICALKLIDAAAVLKLKATFFFFFFLRRTESQSASSFSCCC